MAKGLPQEILHKQFAKEFTTNGLNATQAYKKVKKTTNYKVANVEGSKLLAKPSVRVEISKLLEENGITVSDAMRIHKRNMEQDKQLGVSQTAVQDVYKLTGIINQQNNTPVNIGVFIKQ